MNKQGIILKLKAEREKVWWEWDALNVPTYSSDYDEDYEDTVTRLTLDGTITGLDIAIGILEGR
jgi:hypothetical protein